MGASRQRVAADRHYPVGLKPTATIPYRCKEFPHPGQLHRHDAQSLAASFAGPQRLLPMDACHTSRGLPALAMAWSRGSRYGRGTSAQGGHAMPVHRTELLDDLTALIAAGRELSPDHDRALAEVFIERLTSGMPPHSPTRQVISIWRQPRRLVGTAILGLACLVAGSLLTLHQTGSASVVPVHVSAKGPPILGPGERPILPPGPKVPSVPQAHAPKTAP
jgi:hypothetical protein